MRVIAHRGNLNGPNPLMENDPKRITQCIEMGYDVEIDLRYDTATGTLWLGHDEPQHIVNWMWLAGREKNLWIHCKDVTTLHEFVTRTNGYNFFFHDKDDYTLTSKNHIWAYPGKSYTDRTVVVMPEWSDDPDWDKLRVTNCYGVCTDYAERLTE
jgi:hypothetical protein